MPTSTSLIHSPPSDDDDDLTDANLTPADASLSPAAPPVAAARHPALPTPPIQPDVHANLPHYAPTPADLLLDSVFGDHSHDNDGTHLTGAILDDNVWQTRWLRMVQIAPTWYNAPPGKIGRRFITLFTPQELRGVCTSRLWNSERPLVFVATILQTTPGVRRSKDIRLVSNNAWISGKTTATTRP